MNHHTLQNPIRSTTCENYYSGILKLFWIGASQKAHILPSFSTDKMENQLFLQKSKNNLVEKSYLS
jgi:hypothetical protein